ncbi:hypothetical protein L1987_43038 [Smallanthus sonchifolius]|uniref:Uncharacterized protein n=1 Tax=Smallanthus sonchifolius TaxID=185202 RepID=A0ACB9GKL8_9ASTR|nr:hypothetical protein L1987_43038 [Smallanthus sonchifolius]
MTADHVVATVLVKVKNTIQSFLMLLQGEGDYQVVNVSAKITTSSSEVIVPFLLFNNLMAIANRDSLEEPFDSAINRSSGGGSVAVATVGCGIEPTAVAAIESKKE